MLTYIIAGLTISIFAGLYVRERVRLRNVLKNAKIDLEDKNQKLDSLKKSLNNYTVDPVTEVLGWQLFVDMLNQGVKESARYKFILGVLYVDIDNFNLVNDALGYKQADELLKQFAGRLQKCIRQVDSISRQGKDTFVIHLAQLVKKETAAIIVQRIFKEIEEPFLMQSQEVRLTACMGLSFYPGDGTTAGDLMQHAEYALLRAKKKGKNSYQYYEEDLHADSQRQLSLYNSIASGSYLDELKLEYQAMMDVEQAAPFCIDAQISWVHDEFGHISEDDIFKFTQQQNKLNDLTELLLGQVCERFKKWQEIGIQPKMIAIPVVLKQLESTPFIYKITEIMQKRGVKPENVMFKLRYCNSDVSLDILEKSFNMLNYLGVNTAIENFGRGIFPLRYLKIFSVNYLILGQAIIDNVVEDTQTQLLVQAIASFGDMLSINVIVGDVTEQAQADTLKQLGIKLMQGQLIAEPLSEDEMVARMSDV